MIKIALPWEILLDHLPRNAEMCRVILGLGVMTTGSGPCAEDRFDTFLRQCGLSIDVIWEDLFNTLIVGHEEWDKDQLNRAVEARAGGRLKVYSQEMVLASIAIGADIFDVCSEEELRAFGDAHPALEYLMNNVGFVWPTTEVFIGAGRLVVNFGDFDSSETGLLKHMGYSVGRTGLPISERKEILDRVIGIRLLPSSSADEYYLRQWGLPMTTERLCKAANCLASFVRLKKLDSHRDYSVAIADWEKDLNYLRDKYYRRLSSCFRWPDTDIPLR